MNMFRKSSIFQSYYSLISNHGRIPFVSALISNFNPIIVLFLTWLISYQTFIYYYFNPIIVLFLTDVNYLLENEDEYFNPIIVLFLTQDKNEMYQTVNLFQSYYSLISNTTICTE